MVSNIKNMILCRKEHRNHVHWRSIRLVDSR